MVRSVWRSIVVIKVDGSQVAFSHRVFGIDTLKLQSDRGCSTKILVDPLNNWRHHREDRRTFARAWKLDPYSSAIMFGGWKELEDSAFLHPRRATYEPLHVWLPRTWLLRTGWRRHGLIEAIEVPGGHHAE